MLEIVASGMRFVARWEEELAPRTVVAFRSILPLDDRIIHCRWSGESNWIPWGDRDLGIGPENATSYPHPGGVAGMSKTATSPRSSPPWVGISTRHPLSACPRAVPRRKLSFVLNLCLLA